MKSSQSNFNLQSPDCYWVRSYLITTVMKIFENFDFQSTLLKICQIFVSSVNKFGKSEDDII